jgi:rubrerythrin
MKRKPIDQHQVNELLLQALETERGGIRVYTAAISVAVNDDLREEWEKYLEETKTHEQILLRIFEALELDPEVSTPGRRVVAHQGASLVKAIEMAAQNGEPAAAQLVAAECVVLAETKDHLNWELVGKLCEQGPAELAKVLQPAFDKVEKEEDHHLYHTTGWTRELWIEALGLPAVLPPPEEVKDVETAIGAARAEKAREEML